MANYSASVISGGTHIGFTSVAKAWSYILRTKVYPVELVTADDTRLIYSASADSLPIEELEPSVRVYTILRRNDCLTWGDVLEKAHYNDLRTMRNLGKKSLREVYNILSTLYPDKWEVESARLRDLGESSEDPVEDFTISEADLDDWGPEF